MINSPKSVSVGLCPRLCSAEHTALLWSLS